ncbi:MAG: hypothetical protein U0U69_08395 [Acidimicrobiia bacterium]
MDRSDPVLVVGGGIGGIAAALAVRAAGRDAVVFEREGDRREVVHGTGVIGADGAASIVAAWMHPGVTPHYAGWTAWRGVAGFARTAMPRPPFGETWGPDGRRFGTVPLTGGRVYWYATANRPAGERATSARAEHADLVRDLGGWHAPAAAVLDATDRTPGPVQR